MGENTAPQFDEELAQTYVGRTIIIGLTYLDNAGNLVEERQLHGTISAVRGDGVRIALAGRHAGQTWNMPPDLGNLHEAPAGAYRLRETGEVIVDPDPMTTWTISQSAED
jgi:hypothetical protein